MDLEQPAPEFKTNALHRRERLPNRRSNETLGFEHDGSRYRLSIGFFPDDRPGEIFLNHDRSDSLLDALASDAAILASLALQHGASLQDIRHALRRNSRGEPASPIGAALDRIAP
jgi:hypothetical protein